MGTAKRERQKANRVERQLKQVRATRRRVVKRTALRWGAVATLALGGVVLIAYIGGAFDDTKAEVGDAANLTLPTAPVDTTPQSTVEMPTKPTVELPAEIPTDLVITDLELGVGEPAKLGDTVVVHYVGVLSADGTEFDSSYDGGSPYSVTLGAGRVIDGWEQGLLGVKAGGRRQLDIPSDLGYGETGSGDTIKPGDAITFVIDVVSITPAAG